MDYTICDEAIEHNPQRAYEEIKQIHEESEEMRNDAELLWRFAKACFMWANSLPKKNPKKKLLIFEGRTYASTAYSLDPNNFEALRWTAILIGKSTDFLGPKEKIEQGKLFKTYLDNALEIQPDDFTLLHSRGRFLYEVSNLSWIEKKLCNALFAELPQGTFGDALTNFLEAEKCAPFVWAENLLYVSRCYAQKKNKELARKYLEKVQGIECLDDATKEAINEVHTMVAKLK